MISIGWRNLRRDPARAAVATLGVVFAVVLVTVEVGMLLGLVRNASLLIDESNADLWVSTVNVKTFDFAVPIDQRKRYRIEAVPGVERVEEYQTAYSIWKLQDGGTVNVQIIASEEHSCMAAPLHLVEGRLEALHNQDAVIIDQGEQAKLGSPKIGDTFEILGHRTKIAGFTHNMRSFTTTPYIFTSLRRCDSYGWLTTGGKSMYFLVKVKVGADVESVRAAITATVPGIEVHTRDSLSWRTRKYWLIETGVGLGFLAAAVLGMMVGGVIVSQTLFAMTMEKLPEFGVLKALGATMGEISRVVMEQSLICGAVGLLLGLLLSFGIAGIAEATGKATVEIPIALVGLIVVLTVLICAGAALMSILRLRRIEPGMVFRT